MTMFLLTVHVIVAVLLIGVVLVQRGEGADMGVSFGGGGAQTLFGSRGSGSFLGKLTGALAAVFMMTSLSLAFFSQRHAGSVVERDLGKPGTEQSAPAGSPFDASKLKGGAQKQKPAPQAPLPGAK